MTSNTPPATSEGSLQLELWGSFVTNNLNEVSNTIEIWDMIPKYFLTEKAVKPLRSKDGLSKPYKWQYTHNKDGYEISIQPALIEVEKNQYRAFFPGVTEERVEEALRKILTDQNRFYHDVRKTETWMKFTLKGLQKELKTHSTSRSIDEIKRSISVLNKSVLTVSKNGKEIWSGSILQDLVTVNRDEYLEDADSLHAARLPAFISHSINNLGYRQFNYKRLMRCKNQLTRWIYRRLVHRFTYASFDNSYNFMYSSLKSSGLLQMKREVDNRRKVLEALNELVDQNVLISFKEESRKQGRKIVNVKYVLRPHFEFADEQKTANKRNNDHEFVASKSEHPTLLKAVLSKHRKKRN